MKKSTLIKIIISIGALLILSARLLWPTLKIDVISLGLIIVAILPWLSSLIESAEFPGGWKIKFRDIQQAGDKITGGDDGTTLPNAINTSQTKILPHPDALKMSFSYVLDQDPNLALVGIRIEIEKRMRQLAEIIELNEKQPLSRLLKELKDRGVLADSVYNGLKEIVAAGNQAAHGARVEPSIKDWAFSTGPAILIAIDRKIEKIKSSEYVLDAAARESARTLEGATHVDAMFININNGFAWLIEAKVLSDISYLISFDNFRNQIARNIDVMLDNTSLPGSGLENRDPGRSLFSLLTPVRFKQYPSSRLYGWLMQEYKNNPYALERDLPHRKETNWVDLQQRIGWVTFEDFQEVRPAACPWL